MCILQLRKLYRVTIIIIILSLLLNIVSLKVTMLLSYHHTHTPTPVTTQSRCQVIIRSHCKAQLFFFSIDEAH